MAKRKQIEGVPPWLPIDWRAWLSSPTIQSMSMTQQGIALNIMLKQWVNGDLPRGAWDMAREIKADFQTTRRFLLKYSKFLACCKCGASWTPVDCECGESEVTGRCESQKLKNFYIDAKSGIPLGTTEPNTTYTEPKETTSSDVPSHGVLEEDEIPSPSPIQNIPKTVEKPKVVEVTDGRVQAAPYTPPEEDIDANVVSQAFMKAFGLKMRANKLGYNYETANAAFADFLTRHDQTEVLTIIKYAGGIIQYKRGAQKLNPNNLLPWDWFFEKYEDMKINMEADEDFKKANLKQARAAVGGHAAINPELHTGKRADGTSWTKDEIEL